MIWLFVMCYVSQYFDWDVDYQCKIKGENVQFYCGGKYFFKLFGDQLVVNVGYVKVLVQQIVELENSGIL